MIELFVVFTLGIFVGMVISYVINPKKFEKLETK